MSKRVKESFEALIEQVKNNPKQSIAVFEATSVLGTHLNVQSKTRNFKFNFDEPEFLGGNDSAPNPVEYVLASLGACQAIVYRALASLNNIRLDGLNVKAKGYLDLQGFLGLDTTICPGFNKILFETEIISDEEPDKLYQLSKQVEALCPVLDILSNPIQVSGKLTIKKKAAIALS